MEKETNVPTTSPTSSATPSPHVFSTTVAAVSTSNTSTNTLTTDTSDNKGKHDGDKESSKESEPTTTTAEGTTAIVGTNPIATPAADVGESIVADNNATSASSSLPLHLKSDKSPLVRVPKLERKHSSGDLHSRLKTRKMLGVGETDNGDIHRSKISQVLGHNEHLYLKLPKGYWNWQAFLGALLAFQAGLIIVYPEGAAQLGLVGSEIPKEHVPSQYYAVSMLALSYLLWKFLNLRDKMVVRTTLIAIIIHFSCLCVVDVTNSIRTGLWTTLIDVKVLTMMGLRGLTLTICLLYLKQMGTATSGLRKSPSYKEVSDHNTTGNANRRE